MAELYRIHDAPELIDPVLVVCLDGWIDAGYAAANAVGTMLEGAGYVTVASFDADVLLDHRSRRPTMHIDDGVATGLTWPTIELRAAVDADGGEALFLVGAEPDHLWRAFSTAVVDLAHEFGVTEVLALGAYPAAVPHTRPVRVVATATSADQAHRVGTVAGRIDVPAGIHAAIEVAASESGLPSMSLWAQVPHYAAAMPYQEASEALVAALATQSGLAFPTGTLAQDARATRTRIDELVGNARSFGQATTQFVYYDDAYAGAAQQMRDALGVGEVVRSDQTNSATDLTVVLGEDYLAVVGSDPSTAAEPSTLGGEDG